MFDSNWISQWECVKINSLKSEDRKMVHAKKRKLLLEMYNAGFTQEQIADNLKISKQRISALWKKYKIKKKVRAL